MKLAASYRCAGWRVCWSLFSLVWALLYAFSSRVMAIVVALTTQCVYCIELHRQAALKAGVTGQELAEAVHVAAALRAGGAITHGTHLLEGWPASYRFSFSALAG